MNVLEQTLRTFLHLLVESVPLFLLGAIIGAAVEAWLKPEWVTRWIGGGHRSVAAAAVAGAVLPGCAMSTMPLAQSLRSRGAAVGTLTAFIMIAPILSPHTIMLTATLVSLPMAIGRVVLSLSVSLALGAFLNAMQRRGGWRWGGGSIADSEVDACCSTVGGADALPATVADDDCCSSNDDVIANASSWRRFLAQLLANLRTLTPYLLGGLLAAALVSALVPAETLQT